MPLNDERIITLNCGVGRDSIAMICLLVEGQLEVAGLGVVSPEDIDCVVFSDTGCEWRHTYDAVDQVRELCEAHGLRFIVLEKGDELEARELEPTDWAGIEDKASRGGYHLRPALMDDFQSRQTVASLGKGDCTDNHKIVCIRRLINDISRVRFGLNNRQWGPQIKKLGRLPHISLIGIAADELSRIQESTRSPAYHTEAYPLVTMGIAKPDEQPILERHGLGHVRKSGCWCCPYQPASWYWALSVTEPETWARLIEYERIALERNSRMNITGIKAKKVPLTIAEVVKRWRVANPSATIEAVLTKQYTRCTREARQAARAASATLGAVQASAAPAPSQAVYVPPSPVQLGFNLPEPE